MNIIELKKVSKEFHSGKRGDENGFTLQEMSFGVEKGSIVSLLGPSGCGKTTMLKLIAGLLVPDSGSIFFDGRDITSVPPDKREIVMVFQEGLLFPFMNVAKNISFGLRMRNTPQRVIDEEVENILRKVHLKGYEMRRPADLSGGQRQRVALARALVLHPRLLLLDEPLSNLDANLRYEMRELIIDLKQEFDLTIVFVTHDQEEAILLGDKIALIFDGQLMQYGENHTFFERPTSLEIADFFGNRNRLPAIKERNIAHTNIGDFVIDEDLGIPDGPVWLIIRPNALSTVSRGENCAAYRIVRQIYMGTYFWYRIAFDVTHTLIEDMKSHYEFDMVGAEIAPHDNSRVMFPKNQIWLLPRDPASHDEEPKPIHDEGTGVRNE